MNSLLHKPALPALVALLSLGALQGFATEDKDLWVKQEKNSERLSYRSDKEENRVPDFSHAGYRGGGVMLPSLPARVAVSPVEGDDTALIQAALDYVGALPADAHGLRGAVLLRKGSYQVRGSLVLGKSGVVLRGEGSGEDGSILVATGVDRRPLILVRGSGAPVTSAEPSAKVTSFASVGSNTLQLNSTAGLKKGQGVHVQRPSTKEWIEAVGMHESPGPTGYYWRPGMIDLTWDRIIQSVDGDKVTLDAPLTTALDPVFGGGTVAPYEWAGRIQDVGIENLRLMSDYDRGNPKDESHSWIGVSLEATSNAWVDKVTGLHFAGSLVDVAPSCKWVTVRDCSSLAPVSELGGYRRHSFMIGGGLTLVLRCRAEDGRNDFTSGYQTTGPLVFLECESLRSTGRSGPVGSWASGLLYDNVNIDDGVLALDNLETANQGAGWNAANSVLWQCSASLLICRTPPTARNWAVGVWGQFLGNGTWQTVNSLAKPESLYRAQLQERLGRAALRALEPAVFETDTRSVPDIAKVVPDLAARLAPKPQAPGLPLRLENGWLTVGDRLLSGRQTEVNFWRGQLAPSRSAQERPHLTRFAPGRNGQGLTDVLEVLVGDMAAAGQGMLRHHYGLWYDRRRDDHEITRRIDSETWPPFFELPFARSGQGRAMDGLSLYDLTKYNAWYFMRLQRFADLARDRGLALFSEMYFQHNVLETNAHWADFPWRPANCLQATGFPEPHRYVGGTRIYMAEAFYDLSQPLRRELHRAYIRQCLNALSEQANVIHSLSAEYSGPLHFAQFWIDTVAAWRKERALSPLIALSACKDVQDDVLSDKARSEVVDVIDLKYWWRSPKGLFAPKGGTKLAPRQHEREWKGGKPRASDIASMIWEYRSRFPGKAVICPFPEADGWASLAAGASLPPIPGGTDLEILKAVPAMKPLGPKAASGADCWMLENPGRCMFAYLPAGGEARIVLGAQSPQARVRRINLATGAFLPETSRTSPENKVITLDSKKGDPAAFWIDFPSIS